MILFSLISPFLSWTRELACPGPASCWPGHLPSGSLSPHPAFSSPKTQPPGILLTLTQKPEQELGRGPGPLLHPIYFFHHQYPHNNDR